MSSGARRIVVLASGRGTNLQALIDATTADGPLAGRAEIVAVVSHAPGVLALERAARHGIATLVSTPPRRRRDRAQWDRALADRIAPFDPDVIVLAGWMRILGPGFIDRFPDRAGPGEARILNLHPAPPGELAGVDAIGRAWEEHQQGLRHASGVMVHRVVPEVDAGPVVAFEPVAITPGMSRADFEAAIHATEHRLIVEAVTTFLFGPDRPT